jgi:hypothetical protein
LPSALLIVVEFAEVGDDPLPDARVGANALTQTMHISSLPSTAVAGP